MIVYTQNTVAFYPYCAGEFVVTPKLSAGAGDIALTGDTTVTVTVTTAGAPVKLEA